MEGLGEVVVQPLARLTKADVSVAHNEVYRAAMGIAYEAAEGVLAPVV